jgi:hypothetical protein
MEVDNNFYLYRLSPDGDGDVYGRFPNLMMAEMSADLLMIKDYCFILSGDMTKIYFYYPDKKEWDYDLLTEKGKLDFLDAFPNPKEYK